MQTAFYVEGEFPYDARTGIYEIESLDVMYSITGMADAKVRHKIKRDEILPYAMLPPNFDVMASPSLFHVV